MTRFLRCLIAGCLSFAASIAAAGGLWINTQSDVQFIDTEIGTARWIASISGLRALLAADAQVAWLVDDRIARLLSADGTLVTEIVLPAALTAISSLAAAADPVSGSLYLAADQRVVVLHTAGTSAALPPLPASPLRLAIGIDHRLWAVLPDALWTLDDTGTWQRGRELGSQLTASLRALAVDPLRERLWLIADTQALAIDTHAPAAEPTVVALPRPALAAALDAESGTLWIVTADDLITVEAGGALRSWPHGLPMIEAPATLQFEPASRSLWLASGSHIYGWSETAVGQMWLAFASPPRLVSAAAFDLVPTLALVNTDIPPGAPLAVLIGSQCAGHTCTPSPAYLAGLKAGLRLDGADLDLLEFDAATGFAQYALAASRTVGSHLLEGTPADAFGRSGATLRAVLIAGADGTLHLSAAQSSVVTKAATPPTVRITAPASNTVFSAPATIPIAATATAASGHTITKVEFYKGTTLLGTKTSSPYTFTWTSAAAGTYSLTARATDNIGTAATSSAVTVISNTPPTVGISAPANNARFAAPAGINITANATAATGNTINKVDFYQGSTFLGTKPASPYTFAWSNVTAGTYSLTARVTDSKGSITTSSAISVIVTAPPTVSITVPVNNASYTAPASIAMTASATAASGNTIARVDFYQGTTPLGGKNSSPYTFSWTSVAAGSYSLTAKATDNLGAVTTSAAVNVTVTTAPPAVSITAPANNATFIAPATIAVAANASAGAGHTIARVDFYRDGTFLISRSASPYTYTLTNVAVGSYALTAKATDNKGLATTSAAVNVTVAASQPPTVSITAPAGGSVFGLGAIIPLAAAASSAQGTITQVDYYYAGTNYISTATTSPYSLGWNWYPGPGTYAVTAKATVSNGATATSAPVNVTVSTNHVPDIWLDVSGAGYIVPATFLLTATASDQDGTIAKVEFYNGATLLTTVTNPPYTYVWSGVPTGTYNLTAVAYDDAGFSSVAGINPIIVDGSLPTITVTSPANGATFWSQSQITISGTVTGPAGTQVVVLPGTSNAISASPSGTTYSIDLPMNYSLAGIGTYNIPVRAITPAGAWADTLVTVKSLAPAIWFTSPLDSATTLDDHVTVRGSFLAYGNPQVTVNGAAVTINGTSFTTTVPLTVGANSISATLSSTLPGGASGPSGSSISITRVATSPRSITIGQILNASLNFGDPVLGRGYTLVQVAGTTTGGPDTQVLVDNGKDARVAANVGSDGSFLAVLPLSHGDNTITATAMGPSGPTVSASVPLNLVVPLGQEVAVVMMTAPAPCAAALIAPATVTLAATALATRLALWRVDFYDGDNVVGSAVNAPYTYDWSDIPAGTHIVRARALDVVGRMSAFSAPVTIVVGDGTPYCTLTQPAAGAQFTAPAAITLAASASAPGSTVSKVDFYQGTTLIGSAASAPFSAIWNNAPAGDYSVSATATSATGASTASAPVTVHVAGPLSIALNAPPGNASFSAPATITLQASVSALGSTVTKVEFYQGTTLLGSSASAPYTFTWANVTAADYTLTAKVTTATPASATSAPVTVRVLAGPSATLLAPNNGQSYRSGDVIPFTVQAAIPGHPIDRIEFYSDGSLVGTLPGGGNVQTTATLQWNGANPGTHQLYAKAVATDGTSVTSSTVTVNVVGLLLVTLISPYNGSLFIAPGALYLNAQASEAGGSIAQLQFYQDAALLVTLTSPPYIYVMNNLAAGSYSFSARATDATGQSVTSNAAIVEVIPAAQLAVDAGIDGATVSDDNIDVRGTIQAPGNSGVTVNGMLAAMDANGRYYVNNVPLELGANTLTITLTTPDGNTVTQTVGVTSAGPAPVKISATPTQGLAPLVVTFDISAQPGITIEKVEFDLTGDGLIDNTFLAPPWGGTATYTGTGSFEALVKVTTQTNVYTRSIAIVLTDPVRLDRNLRAVWSGMTSALAAGNKAVAMQYLNASAKNRYGPVFDALLPQMAQIVGLFSVPQTSTLSNGIGEYIVNRMINGENRAFFHYFTQDGDGVWRLNSM